MIEVRQVVAGAIGAEISASIWSSSKTPPTTTGLPQRHVAHPLKGDALR